MVTYCRFCMTFILFIFAFIKVGTPLIKGNYLMGTNSVASLSTSCKDGLCFIRFAQNSFTFFVSFFLSSLNKIFIDNLDVLNKLLGLILDARWYRLGIFFLQVMEHMFSHHSHQLTSGRMSHQWKVQKGFRMVEFHVENVQRGLKLFNPFIFNLFMFSLIII